MRYMRMMKPHEKAINALAWSPDGKYVTTSVTYGQLGLWDVESGKTLAEYTVRDSIINTHTWSPDSAALACGSQNGALHIWKIQASATM